MTRKEMLLECKDHLEDYMKKVETSRDIWQSDAYWWLSKACCEIIAMLVGLYDKFKDDGK